jgi:hypothetical protein
MHVGLASVSTQSKRLTALLAEIERIVVQMKSPLLSKRVADLQIELERAQGTMLEKPEDFKQLSEISKQVIELLSTTETSTAWSESILKGQVLRTKRDGLFARLNIQTINLNGYKIDKARCGGQLVPPILAASIEDMKKEITETQAQIDEVRQQLAALGTN